MLYLNVPFNEKDEAKSLYAKWDNQKKQWYATKPEFYYKFRKWIDGNLVFSDSIMIIEGKIDCWKCNNRISVFAFGVNSSNVIDILENRPIDIFKETGYDIQIWRISEDIPEKIREILTKDFGCKMKYSKTINEVYFANVCPHCDSLQGDYFLYDEPASPFGERSDSELILHKINLSHDIPTYLYINKQVTPDIIYMNRASVIETSYKV
ncbi:hypothetical protein SAMN04487774_10840 [Enterococcus faecalis]|uniref:DUF5710 domain-containing protein n=1 Tax=Enterococcus faecalis TaxID=1351 RepID=UPI00045B805A|nr:DUF5710 domain-containing protein [Enterococcus faecalis]KAJ79744.1 putative DNA primase [Enterococcus faecalis MTUP9]SDN76028.1 hypothetical protein SAMN04487774_10840 [Enterococcus faecalis]